MNLQRLGDALHRAEGSTARRWWLSWCLWRMVPFNRAHGFIIHGVDRDRVSVSIPFSRANRNHIRTMHACAMATGAEYSSGLHLLYHLKGCEFIFVLRELRMTYLKPAKGPCTAECRPFEVLWRVAVPDQLARGESVTLPLPVRIYREGSEELVAEGEVEWHLRSPSQ